MLIGFHKEDGMRCWLLVRRVDCIGLRPKAWAITRQPLH